MKRKSVRKKRHVKGELPAKVRRMIGLAKAIAANNDKLLVDLVEQSEVCSTLVEQLDLIKKEEDFFSLWQQINPEIARLDAQIMRAGARHIHYLSQLTALMRLKRSSRIRKKASRAA